MPFGTGNKAARGANHQKRKVVTQQLISELNEADENKVKRVRKIVQALCAKAEEGDVQAIKEIFDRTEGKAPQPVTGEDGDGPMKLVISWAKSE